MNYIDTTSHDCRLLEITVYVRPYNTGKRLLMMDIWFAGLSLFLSASKMLPRTLQFFRTTKMPPCAFLAWNLVSMMSIFSNIVLSTWLAAFEPYASVIAGPLFDSPAATAALASSVLSCLYMIDVYVLSKTVSEVFHDTTEGLVPPPCFQPRIVDHLSLMSLLGHHRESLYLAHVLVVLRIGRLVRYASWWERVLLLNTDTISHKPIRMGHLFLSMFFAAHMLGCGWYLIARLEGYPENNNDFLPPPPSRTKDESLTVQYFKCLFWSMSLMAGSEIHKPNTPVEYLFIFGSIGVGISLWATMVGGLSAMLESSNQRVDQWRTAMAAARSISEEFDLSKCMARRLRSSMTATLLLADTPNENAQGSLAMEAIEAYLPEYLKKELAASVHKKLFDNVSIFKNTTPAFLEALARRLRPQVCLAGDCLIREGDIDKEMYFVRSGELQVIAWNSEKDQEIVLHTLRPGSFCGELALVADVKRTATVRATVLSWLLMLTEEDMRLAHERFPDDFLIVQDVARLRLQEHRRKTGYSEKLKAAKQKLRLISAGRVLAHNAATRRFLGFSSESSSVPESPATPLTPTVTRSRPERETPEGHISSPDSSITQLTQVTRRSYTDIEDLILDPLVSFARTPASTAK